MNTQAKEILRWAAIVLFGGYGVLQLIEAGYLAAESPSDGFALEFSVFGGLFALPFLAVAYFCLRRQYRQLYLVLGAVGCLAIFVALSVLPTLLGVSEFIRRHEQENHAFGIFFLPLVLLTLFVPVYAAAWFYRFCHRFAYPNADKKPKTRATRWLVWLGIVSAALPPMVGMCMTFRQITQSPNAPVPPETASHLFNWTTSLVLIGCFLVFLGLARRQPVADPCEELPSTTVDQRGG